MAKQKVTRVFYGAPKDMLPEEQDSVDVTSIYDDKNIFETLKNYSIAQSKDMPTEVFVVGGKLVFKK